MKFSKQLILLALFIPGMTDLIFCQNYNPDGEVFQPGFGFSYGSTSVRSSSVSQGAFAFLLPISRYFSLQGAYGIADTKYNRSTQVGLLGFTFYTSPIKNYSQLQNPDGEIKSIVFTLIGGNNFTSYKRNGFNGSVSLGYIVSKKTTLEIFYNYSDVISSSSQILNLNLRIHSGSSSSIKMVNPDGKVGSPTLIPKIGGVFTNRESGFSFGFGIIAPVRNNLSLGGDFSYFKFEYYSGTTFSVGISIYFI